MTTLADLRKENLKQMNRTEEGAPPSPPEGLRASETTETTPPLTAPSSSVVTEDRTSVTTEGRKDGSTQVRTRVRKSANTAVRTEPSTDEGVAGTAAADSLLEAVREALAKKTVHPVGVKTTVEMPAELSQRAKRYSLDHGNVPVRQVFLELMITFLEKEGY